MLDFKTKILNGKGPCIFSVGQAGYIIKSSNGQLLAIDLYLSNCVERLEKHVGFRRLLPQILSPNDVSFDVVICTHPHLDHFDFDAVPEMVANGCKLLCSVDCEKLVRQLELDYYNDRISYVKPGDRVIIEDFDIQFVNCDHGTGAPDAVGVVIAVDGKVIYEVGDSCLRMDRIGEIPQPIDVLIAPINGMYGNMNSDDVAELASALRPKFTVPCHYGMFASHGGDLKRFYDLMTERALPVRMMCQGEMISL